MDSLHHQEIDTNEKLEPGQVSIAATNYLTKHWKWASFSHVDAEEEVDRGR